MMMFDMGLKSDTSCSNKQDHAESTTSLTPPFKAEKNNTVFALVLLINKAIIPEFCN